MKKKLFIVLVAFFLLLLVSCGEEKPNSEVVDPPTPSEEVPSETEKEKEEEPIKEEITELISITDLEISDGKAINLESICNIDYKLIEFMVSDNSVIEVVDGKIVPLLMGESTLWADYENKTSEVNVRVMPNFVCEACDEDKTIYVGDRTEIIILNYNGSSNDFEILSTNDNVEINGTEVRFVKPGEVDIALVYKKDPSFNARLSFDIKKTKPILTADTLEAEVDDYVQFGVSNYASIEMFNIYCSDESILELDSDYYGLALKPGKVTVTIKLKEDEKVSASLEVTVKNVEIKARLSYQRLIIGDEFTIDLYSYNSEDVFNFNISDEAVVTKIGTKTYKAVGEGSATLTVSLKEDPNTKLVLDLVVYRKEPIIQIGSSTIQVGQTSKIQLSNYVNLKDFDISFSDASLIELKDDNFTALKEGNLVITVTKKDDPSVTSKVSLEIIPIQPKIYLSSEYIKVGGTSGLFLKNASEILEESLDDFNIEIENKGIVSLDNYILTGLKEGETKISFVSKINNKSKGEVIINVTKTSSALDDNGEPNEGVLLLSVNNNSNAYLEAGEFYQVLIDASSDREHYKWVTTDALVAVVNDTGRVIAVNSGVAQIAAISKTNNEVKGLITVTVYGIPNVDYAARLVRVATEELGYREGPNNDTKYGEWYHLNYEAWCAMFVSWCCNQAGISTDIVPKYCGCTAGMNWFKQRDQFQYRESGYIPKAGDIAFYKDSGATEGTSTHTGIVYAATSTTVYTIEGNTSDMCAKRSYSINSSYIVGYGVPNYPEFEGEPATFTPGRPENGENHSTR